MWSDIWKTNHLSTLILANTLPILVEFIIIIELIALPSRFHTTTLMWYSAAGRNVCVGSLLLSHQHLVMAESQLDSGKEVHVPFFLFANKWLYKTGWSVLCSHLKLPSWDINFNFIECLDSCTSLTWHLK